jgi:WD40 repeat protein
MFGSGSNIVHNVRNRTVASLIVQLVGHIDSVDSVAFFPDGKQIMSDSLDGTIRVWDVELLEERGEMDGWQVKQEYPNWILGPKGELLFWTPLPFRHTRNTLIIGECPKIDFSNFVHGDEWVKCREPL